MINSKIVLEILEKIGLGAEEYNKYLLPKQEMVIRPASKAPKLKKQTKLLTKETMLYDIQQLSSMMNGVDLRKAVQRSYTRAAVLPTFELTFRVNYKPIKHQFTGEVSKYHHTYKYVSPCNTCWVERIRRNMETYKYGIFEDVLDEYYSKHGTGQSMKIAYVPKQEKLRTLVFIDKINTGDKSITKVADLNYCTIYKKKLNGAIIYAVPAYHDTHLQKYYVPYYVANEAIDRLEDEGLTLKMYNGVPFKLVNCSITWEHNLSYGKGCTISYVYRKAIVGTTHQPIDIVGALSLSRRDLVRYNVLNEQILVHTNVDIVKALINKFGNVSTIEYTKEFLENLSIGDKLLSDTYLYENYYTHESIECYSNKKYEYDASDKDAVDNRIVIYTDNKNAADIDNKHIKFIYQEKVRKYPRQWKFVDAVNRTANKNTGLYEPTISYVNDPDLTVKESATYEWIVNKTKFRTTKQYAIMPNGVKIQMSSKTQFVDKETPKAVSADVTSAVRVLYDLNADMYTAEDMEQIFSKEEYISALQPTLQVINEEFIPVIHWRNEYLHFIYNIPIKKLEKINFIKSCVITQGFIVMNYKTNGLTHRVKVRCFGYSLAAANLLERIDVAIKVVETFYGIKLNYKPNIVFEHCKDIMFDSSEYLSLDNGLYKKVGTSLEEDAYDDKKEECE